MASRQEILNIWCTQRDCKDRLQKAPPSVMPRTIRLFKLHVTAAADIVSSTSLHALIWYIADHIFEGTVQ